ncbi:CCR4-NOT transcription complex subunit 1-like [Venturia canescens]|uniref:CCR4-NOT transcription complex subunit 1-like n=1 Tax=Venturia canescens TaxID=32260 RepID=UPI001C9C6709|nr:CCR4-NOT transcription complex subunit 1-like [Venturia canescens]XP_043271973.1 CCR4-NOT transcription complex subunit 1-like [Venturia canescens]
MLPSSSQLHSDPLGSPKPPRKPGGAAIGELGLSRSPCDVEGLPVSGTLDVVPNMARTVLEDIENEANSYFQRIYNNPPQPTLSIDEILDVMIKLRESKAERENKIFNCMLRNLFGEYQYFPRYPKKALHITAQLFGGIIERNVISAQALGCALQIVLDALKKPKNSKVHYFGITALDCFKTRLQEWQSYCKQIKAIRNFNELPPHLIKCVQFSLQAQNPSTWPRAVLLQSSTTILATSSNTIASATVTTSTRRSKLTSTSTSTSARRSIANATNVDMPLVAAGKHKNIVAPPEALQDKIVSIFNNLIQSNLREKCDDIRKIVSKEFWPWMARYLVVNRASSERNFHALYSNFLDCLRQPYFNKIVTRETLHNIKVLLRRKKSLKNFSDRSLLRNLGHWLGMLTLRRNKPILYIDIDLKSLILEAYHKEQQELLYVGPFVARILESCAKSRVFRPPNPWTMAIMRVLAELHQEPDLKLYLKFEIEALCKQLNIDIANLKPVVYLKNPQKLCALEYQLLPLPKNLEDAHRPSQQQRQRVPTPVEELIESIPGSNVLQAIPAADATPPFSSTSQSEPRFDYADVSMNVIAAVSQHIKININLTLFQLEPNLKLLIRPTVERAIHESLPSLVSRSIAVALAASEQIVRKDFALDPDEVRITTAARLMVRSLTAAMMMTTCRSQILASMSSHLKEVFLRTVTGLNFLQEELAEQAANVVSAENVDLACAFLQKTAIEIAMQEIDKRLSNEIHLRKTARQEVRSYYDPVAKFQADRMPDKIRLNASGVTPRQMAVYEEFAQNIPGFLPLSERNEPSIPKPLNETSVTVLTGYPVAVPLPSILHVTSPGCAINDDKVGTMLEKLAGEIEALLSSLRFAVSSPQYAALYSLFESVILMRRSQDTGAALILLKKAVEGLLENSTISGSVVDSSIIVNYREVHLKVLKCLQHPSVYGMQWTNRHVNHCLIECCHKFHYNFEAIDLIVEADLLDLVQFDLTLAQAMEFGDRMVILFATQLLQSHLIDRRETTHLTESDFIYTINVLTRIVHQRAAPEGISIAKLSSLIGSLQAYRDPDTLISRVPSGPTTHSNPGSFQFEVQNVHNLPDLMKKSNFLLHEWVKIYYFPAHSHYATEVFGIFVQRMNIHGLLKTKDSITLFFKIGTQMCVDHCYAALAETSATPSTLRANSFRIVDAFVHLVALLIKHLDDTLNPHTKIDLLNNVLGIVAGALTQDHEFRGTEFHQLPYQRILIMLLLELCSPEPILRAFSFEILTAFCRTFHILRPAKVAGFCYAWLELVSHRAFISCIFAMEPHEKCWGMYARLLIDLFEFLRPHLRNANLSRPVNLFYKGTLRVLLVLLHDFPEFLCDYYYDFCDVIPQDCIQLRNLILSAHPRAVRLPDPSTLNLKVDMLQEITYVPRVLTNFAAVIKPNLKNQLDLYLETRTPVTFLSDLTTNLHVRQENGTHINIPLINAIVLYVGSHAIALMRNQGHAFDVSTIASSSHMDVFQKLAVDLDPASRYSFFNAIANQLRYPSTHTYYFCCILLCLFAEAKTEEIQEHITIVLLERLIVNQPHPWGLLITFIELVKNPKYAFWSLEFVRSASEIEKFIETITHLYMIQQQVEPPSKPQEPEL